MVESGRPGRRFLRFRFATLLLAGCAVAALLAGSARAVDPAFTAAPESPITTGSGAISVAAADLNGDGRQDLAVANQGANNVSILLSDGDGTFTNASGSPVSVGTDPVAVVAADLNGAGGLDLAVANEDLNGPGTVSILLGNGNGTFGAASSITTGPSGSGPQSIAVGNFNGAGGLDLAVAHENDTPANAPGFVTILLGNGTGGFPTSSTVNVGRLPQSVVAGNFNADANTDLAVANEVSGNVSVLFGNGAGSFPTSSTIPAGTDPNDIAAADLNGAGGLDLIVANAGGNNVSILLGTGAGSFSNAPGSPVGVGASPEGIAFADLNVDGKLDLAVANAGGTTMSILVGDGSGGFTAAAAVPANGDPTTPVAALFDADTKPDLAVANYASGDVTVALNTTPTNPTAVTLTAFAARVTPKGVELRWRTAQETGILGFEVYRSGKRLNRTLIPAGGSAAGYRLLDRGARRTGASVYRLRVVRADGTRAWVARALAGA